MRQRTRLIVGTAVAVALLAGALIGVSTTEAPSAGASRTASAASFSEAAVAGVGRKDTAATVTELEALVATSPENVDALGTLGLAYQVRWRETGDASFLPRAQTALDRALAQRRDDPNATLGLGNLSLIRHQFRQALVVGRNAQRLAPYSARPLGVIGDAQIELGRYAEAFASFERMAALRPSLAAYARIAYARELSGDVPGAIAAMGLALDAAGGQPEPAAWTEVELGKLEFGRGRVDAAAPHYRAALAIRPGYAYAYEQLARVEEARGRLDRALEAARSAAATLPLPQFVGLFGDLLERRGATSEARRQRATVAAIDRLLAANGISVDLESALYRADHGIGLQANVTLARKARADRPSIYGDDALGWSLARAGRCDEAVNWSELSLRLGTKDALLWFHRGYAAGCAGDRAGMRAWYAKALALNPHFSIIWAPVARRGAS